MAKKTLVLKFGGTSVADKSALNNVAKIIERHKPDKMCIVLSALGKTQKYGKITDVLIDLKASAKKEKILWSIKKRHTDLIDACIPDKKHNASAKKQIELLISEIETHQDDPGYPIECFGEKMSAQLIYYMLKEKGHDITYVNAFDAIHFINANPYFQKIHDSCRIIKDHLNSGKITITEGFIANESGKMTSMSRGGSDQTATLIGKAIDADEVIIYSDQDGVLTADPKIVKSAKIV
ncbi:MAG: hypothetical protein U9Q92_06590, partial [archaeon]|nr:hypothetical protein [archaeon]